MTTLTPGLEVLRSGTWAYAGVVRGHVWLVRQPSDYYWDDAGEGEPDLGPDGYAYYVLYSLSHTLDGRASRSRTCLSETEAEELAASSLSDLRWG